MTTSWRRQKAEQHRGKQAIDGRTAGWTDRSGVEKLDDGLTGVGVLEALLHVLFGLVALALGQFRVLRDQHRLLELGGVHGWRLKRRPAIEDERGNTRIRGGGIETVVVVVVVGAGRARRTPDTT